MCTLRWLCNFRWLCNLKCKSQWLSTTTGMHKTAQCFIHLQPRDKHILPTVRIFKKLASSVVASGGYCVVDVSFAASP